MKYKKTRVMHIITRMDRGGSAQNTLLTCLGLRDNYQMILIHGPTKESNMGDQERYTINTQLEYLKKGNGFVILNPYLIREISPKEDLLAFLWLLKIIRYHRPSIVHTHTSKAGVLGRLAAFLCGVRIIVHTPHGHVFYGHFSPMKARIFLWIERMMGLITTRIVALTENEKNDYIRFSVYPSRKITTIHSGIQVDIFMNPTIPPQLKKKELGLDPDAPVIGTAGWISKVKGSINLLMAMNRVWEKHPSCQLVFAGRGELESMMKDTAKKITYPEKVLLLGWRNDMPDIMHMLDLFVLPSLNEGMGRVVVEAMSAGKPVIASRVGGIVDLVKHGENGYLVTPGDIDELAHAIIDLLDNMDTAIEMGRKGKELCKEFSVEYMIEKIDILYRDLMKPKKCS